MNAPVTHTEISRWGPDGWHLKNDLLAVEEPLEIRLGYGRESREQKSLSITMRTPGHDFELALGFLISEGVIARAEDIDTIHYCENVRPEERGNVLRVELKPDVKVDWVSLQRHFYTSSSCGVCGKTSIESVCTRVVPVPVRWTLSPSMVMSLPERLAQGQAIFQNTGGLHAVGVFDRDGKLLILREDVGRHNAFDKVGGAIVMNAALDPEECMVLLSGRASFELVQKAIANRIPFVASIGAPSSLACALAKQAHITLVGFVRNTGFNVYATPERVI